MNFSAIDIGSNAIRQLVVSVDSAGNWKILKKHRACIRLGADVFNGGLILPATQKKLVPEFKKMAKNIKKYKVQKSLAIATSAFRDCKNKNQVIANVFKNSQIKIKVITGKKEAELIKLAVQSAIGYNPYNYLLIDIGGGSLELTHLFNKKTIYSKSFKLGAVRLNNLAAKQKKPVQKIITESLHHKKIPLPKGEFNFAVGTGGNLDAMAKLKINYLKKAPNTFIELSDLQKIYSDFIKTKPSMRAQKFNLKPDRVDVLVPALYLTIEILKKYHISKIKIPGVGLKEGAIHSLV